jgi:hypothetical protein
MPLIQQIVQYHENYNSGDWTSATINLQNVASIQFICYSTVDCQMSVSWFTTLDDPTVIYQDNVSCTGGTSGQIQVTCRTEFAKFSVTNFASSPVLLFNTSGMYFLQNNVVSQGIQGPTGPQGVTGATGATFHYLSFNYGQSLNDAYVYDRYFGTFVSDYPNDCYQLVSGPMRIHEVTTYLGPPAYIPGYTGTRVITPYVNDALETDYQIQYNQPTDGYLSVEYEKYFSNENNLICMAHHTGIFGETPYANSGLLARIKYSL